jgi:N-acetylglutamate synthase-like GNAT family acetyltransferase
MTPGAISLRPVKPEDKPFLLQLYASSRESEMAMVPWPAQQKEAFLTSQFEAQTRDYSTRHPQAEHAILLLDGCEVGRCFVSREKDRIHILDLTVLTAKRKTGAGSKLVQRLQHEAAETRVPLNIYVETFNPSVGFFTKRGFVPEKQEGIHVLLKWMP